MFEPKATASHLDSTRKADVDLKSNSWSSFIMRRRAFIGCGIYILLAMEIEAPLRTTGRNGRKAYEPQCGDRSNDLNKLPKASCRHRNTLLVVLP